MCFESVAGFKEATLYVLYQRWWGNKTMVTLLFVLIVQCSAGPTSVSICDLVFYFSVVLPPIPYLYYYLCPHLHKVATPRITGKENGIFYCRFSLFSLSRMGTEEESSENKSESIVDEKMKKKHNVHHMSTNHIIFLGLQGKKRK